MKTNLLSTLLFLTTAFCNAQWSFTDLTESRFRMGVTSLGTKVFFAGGELSNGEQASAIEVYDIASDKWDTVINLLVPRSHIACVSCGTKVFFAGGIDFGTFTFYDVIEIWDTETGLWDFKQLSAPRFSISAVSYGNKVMFAGGANLLLGTTFDLVEIYDIETGEWETNFLSVPRSAMGATVLGDLAFFAGGSGPQGISNRVDIYNFTTGTWDIASLSQARVFLTATAVGTKVLFAGGTTPENESSSRVDIYDTETGEWSIDSLSQARAFWESNSASRCDQFAYFVGGGIFNLNSNQYGYPFNTIDIYDVANDEWTIDTTYAPILAHSVIGVEDHLLIAGGMTPVGVSSRVQILNDTCIWSGVGSAVGGQQSEVIIYPNPTQGFVNLQFTVCNLESINLRIYDVQGREVAVVLDGEWSGDQVVGWDVSNLPAGVYYYRLTTKDDQRPKTGKIVKH